MQIKTLSRRLYRAFERAIVPNLRHSQSLYADVLMDAVQPHSTWLDLGCGHRILRPDRFDDEVELVNRCALVVGLDYDLPSMQRHHTIRHAVQGSVDALPFPDEAFDLVTANMVVEHLDRPGRQFAEIARVLKPGGVFIFHTPNAWGYYTMIARMIPNAIKPKLVYLLEGRKEEDVFPTHYRVNSRARIVRLARESGLHLARLRLVSSTGHSTLAIVPPLSVLQLAWLRLLMFRSLRGLRPYIIATLQKAGGPNGRPSEAKAAEAILTTAGADR